MQTLFADVKHSLRMLVKAPAFAAIAILSLGIGIGATTTMYSVVDAVLLRKLNVKDPEQLVVFNWQAGKPFRTTGIRGTFVSGGYPEGMRGFSSFQARLFNQMRERQKYDPASPLSSVFAFADVYEMNVVAHNHAALAPAQVVSGNYFSTLGVSPHLGRLISDDDDRASSTASAVLSYGYWRDRFGADPALIGQKIKVNQVDFTVIGVTPPGFQAPGQVGFVPSVTMPIAFEPLIERQRPMVDTPERLAPWWLLVMGRLKPGATLEQAHASLDEPFRALALEMMPAPTKPDQPATLLAKDEPHLVLRPGSRGQWEHRSVYASKIYLLLGVVGLVLLLACANVASLLLTRAVQRAPEVTVRMAIGASRLRLLRQMLTESLVLSSLGGVLGVLLSVWGLEAMRVLGAFGNANSSALFPIDVDYAWNGRVLAFALLISVGTGLLFGIAPALRSVRQDLAPALKDGAKGGMGRSRLQLGQALVVVQVAASLVLLVGAGLFVRSVLNLQRVDLGFNQANLLNFDLQPGNNDYTGERIKDLYTQLAERVAALPAVRSVTFAQMPLIAQTYYGYSLVLPGETASSAADHSANLLIVRENYLEVMEMALLRGRRLTEQDNEAGLRVALVSETLAKKYFPNQDAIGQRIGFDEGSKDRFEIVGIVRDINYASQRQDKEPVLFVPWRQWSEPIGEVTFSVRAQGDPTTLSSEIREVVRKLDASLPIARVTTQAAQSAETLSEETLYARLVSVFGGLALLLSGIGLYGVMAYSVTQRTREIGIRMALGAQARGVLSSVLRQAFGLVILGVCLGGVGAAALKKFIASQLFGVDAADPLTLLGVIALMLVTTLTACLVPGRRAIRVDPIDALRCE